MFKVFISEKRYKDYINIREFEVYMSVLISMLFVLLVYHTDLYSNFFDVQADFCNLVLYFIAGFFGLLGFILTGVAIVIGMFNKELSTRIELANGKGTVKKLLSSYEFLAVNIVMAILVLVILYILTLSELSIVADKLFYIIVFLVSYYLLFCIFYALALIKNLIVIYEITLLYSGDNGVSNETMIRCNEIRIDFILRTLTEKYGIGIEEFSDALEKFASNADNNNAVNSYLKSYYKVDE